MQKLFYIQTGGGASLHSLDPAIQPVLPSSVGVEQRYLEGWNRFWQNAAPTANAANTGGSRLRNPVGSGVVVVVEKAFCRINAAVATITFISISAGPATTDLTTAGTGLAMDTRGNQQSSAILSVSNTSPANLSTIVNIFGVNDLGSDFILFPDQEWIIMPGTAIQMTSQTANEAETMHWTWRERVLESSELT